MDNEKDCGAEKDFLSPKSSLVDAEAMGGKDEGMQKDMNRDNGVPARENGEPLPYPQQSNEAESAIELEDGFAHQGSALPSPLDEQQESAPKEEASEKGGLIDSKHAADIALANAEPQIEGLEEIRQGEAPVEIEQESIVKASAGIQHELDGDPSIEAQSIASHLLETVQERQDRAEPEHGGTGVSELGEGDTSGREEYNIEEQLANDAAGTSFTMGVSQEAGVVQQQGAAELVEKDIVVSEVNPEKSEEQILNHSASEELNEQVDLEIPIGDVSKEPPAPDDALLMKEPSLSTPAMEALIDADDEEPSHEEESFGTVENFEQHLDATETHGDSACGDIQDAFQGISNQVEVDNNEQERAEVEGSYVTHSTEPVSELGKVSNGTIEGEAPITMLSEKGLLYHDMTAKDDKHESTEKGLLYHDMTAKDDKHESTSKPLIYNNSESGDESREVSEVGAYAAEAKDRELDAGKGKAIVGGAKGVPSHTDATNTSNIMAQENGFLKKSQGDFEKESQAKPYTNGAANTCIIDKENAQAFYNESSREASLSLVVPQQRDRVLEHVGEEDADRTKGRETMVCRTNWWGCCGMLDLLLHKDQ